MILQFYKSEWMHIHALQKYFQFEVLQDCQ